MVDRSKDTAGVLVRPPLLYLAALLLGTVSELVWPLSGQIGSAGIVQILAGSLFLGAGVVMLFLAFSRFAAAGTQVPTWRPTTALVTGGVYAFSRNPIYLGLNAAYVGIALCLNLYWPIIFLPLVLIAMHFGVIRREERYLSAKFGESYLDYSRRVRRYV